jgi:uncharacterized HAD superfamily protein
MNERIGNEFHEYLKAEYRHIAEAHFRTIEAISSFFRYYLLIMSLPITLIALSMALSSQAEELLGAIFRLGPLLSAILFVISLVGFCVLLYIINLRMDVVLYARTINAIRKHFYDQAPMMDINTKLRTRVLPQTPFQPGYVEHRYFLPVVLSFALFDTFYLFWALTLLGGTTPTDITFQSIPWWAWWGLGFLVVHYGAYRWLAWHREHSYLKSYAIGVDIDGVLNEHREHFCKLLEENVGKKLDPENITTIPLHDCPALEVSREDEKKVFNDPRYWTEMPVMDDAAPNLARLRNLNLKVHIFSHRAWPNSTDMKQGDRKMMREQWSNRALAFMQETYGEKGLCSVLNRMRLRIGVPKDETVKTARSRVDKQLISWVRWVRTTFGNRPIEQITRCWLRVHGLDCDELTIERGNEDVADPQGHFRNRFYIARQKKIRFFVEDDLDKAIKLAYICDVVFLLEHPYNRNSQEKCQECGRQCKQEGRNVPDNVKPVKSWDEIYRCVRRLS